MMAIQDQQEIMGAIADIIIEVFAMESAILRAQKIAHSKGEAGAATAIAMAQAYSSTAMDKIEANSRKVLAACSEGDDLRTQIAILRRFFKYEPVNAIGLRQQIAQKVIEAGKYMI